MIRSKPRSEPSGSLREGTPEDPRVGEYRLLTRIGEGGMGVVHLAQAPDGRRVALKVLRPHVIGDDEARERLAREVASLSRVRSPRIAEIVDADPWGETPFVATRYVPGLSLHEHVRREGPLAGEDLRMFARQLAEAMVAVHRVGVLHRDIKPSNVLLEGRSPVLIDFGLARLAEDPRLTATGWLLGTPGYLAPEILYGDDATTASDVHAWAATVVLAATGRPPFGRGPAMAIMDRVRRGEHDLSGVPAFLLPLLRSCLAPDPAARPDTGTLLRSLGAPAGSPEPPRGSDELTMPLALGGDSDPTDVLPWAGSPVEDPTLRHHIPAPAPPRTRRFEPGNPADRPVPPPARAPYMTPAPPQQPQPPPGPSGTTTRFLRGALLAGLFALVTVGFALAPYLAIAGLTLTVLAVRALSWTADSARNRAYRRGGRAWYDVPLAAASSPWYLLVATGGTLLLLLWSATVALVAGLVGLLLTVPLEPTLLAMGAVLAVSLWWGPGSRRLRVPTRRLAVRLSGPDWAGWLALGLVAVAVLLCALGLLTSGVTWDPQPGPPWRPGTLLGRMVGYF